MTLWRPVEGRFTALKKAWFVESKVHVATAFINSLPIILFPLGEKRYYELEDKYGAQTWWSPVNLWRELFHMAGGAMLVLPLPHPTGVAAVVVLVAMVVKELMIDARQDGLHFKNFLDAFCWTLGAYLITLIK